MMFFKKAMISIGAVFVAACVSAAQLSRIETETESYQKIRVLVDEKPFFLNVAELSINRFFNPDLFGWSDEEIEPILHQIKEDGFTAVKLAYYWGQIETAKDRFNWHMIDRSIDFCIRADLPMILNWWGSEFCEVSWIYDGLLPEYVTTDYEYVRDPQGNRIEVNYNYHLDTRPYPKLDKCDDRLLERESYVLKTIMNHIHDYIESKNYPNIVIGVQVQNEPTVVRMFGEMPVERSYSPCAVEKWEKGGWTDAGAFRRSVMFNYLNGLAKAVKTSRCPVWTCANFVGGANGPISPDGSSGAICISENEIARGRGESYLDFIGVDIYQDDPEFFYNLLTDRYFIQGKNFVHTPETGITYRSLPQIHFNVLAANGSLGVWEIVQSGDWHWANTWNLYRTTEDHRFEVRDERWLRRVRDFNRFLLKNRQAFAEYKAGGDRLQFFNRKMEPQFKQWQKIGVHGIDFKTVCGAGGIVSVNEGGLVLMATDYATFGMKVPGDMSLERGFYGADGVWNKVSDIVFEKRGQWITAEADPYDCIRCVFK